MVITSNGRPVAILAAVDEANLEASLRGFRRGRAMDALGKLQRGSVDHGHDARGPAEVETEIDDAEGLQVAADPLSTRLRDPDDEPFLEVAVAGGAACLVTGNLTHYPPAARAGMAVIAPAEFLRWFRLHRAPSPHSPR